MPLQTPTLTVGLFTALLALGGCGQKAATAATRPAATEPASRPSDGRQWVRFDYAQVHMGMKVTLSGYAESVEKAEAAGKAAYRRIAELDAILSDYRLTSELNRLCNKAGGPPVPVSEDLFLVLARSKEMWERSGGAFDVTAGPLVRLWREARKSGEMPGGAALEAAKKLVGSEKMVLDAEKRTVQLLVPGMKLDLGGIAKGYAGDCAIEALRERGVASAAFEAGGDLVFGDAPPGTGGWRVEVTGEKTATGPLVIEAANCAVSTSGDTEQFVVIGGKRYSHVVDPRTGLGITNRLITTVLAPKGLVSDPLSKMFGMLGEEEGRELAGAYPGVRVWVREAEGEKFEVRMTNQARSSNDEGRSLKSEVRNSNDESSSKLE